ncbi:MAG: sulfatase-like hydrolase/transferase [Steroidobacteraceae bacterium]
MILIVADDLGSGDLGAYGGSIATPHIDALARSGIRYSSAYATAPICSPSRAGLLSGRFQGRFGFYFNLVGRDTGMPAGETTIAEVAKAAGYRTAMIGKWHVGEGPGREPLDQGFDSFFGFLGGATSYFPDGTPGLITADTGADKLVTRARFPILRNREVVEPPGNITDVFTAEAIRFIDSSRDQPFFLYLAYNAPHMPFQATAEEVAPFAATPSVSSRVYQAMITTLDAGVGRLVDALRARGLEKNTIVYFISDNGCPNYTHGACSNAPYSGWKAFPLEGGIRVPFILSAPGRVPPGQIESRLVSTLDIMPTVAAVMGRPAPASSEGQDLLASQDRYGERALYWRMGPNHWARQGPWKLITINKAAEVQSLSEVVGKPLPDAVPSGVSSLGQWQLLFNLDLDPGETLDVAARHRDAAGLLQQGYATWDEKNLAPAFPSRREFRTEMVGRKVQLIF